MPREKNRGGGTGWMWYVICHRVGLKTANQAQQYTRGGRIHTGIVGRHTLEGGGGYTQGKKWTGMKPWFGDAEILMEFIGGGCWVIKPCHYLNIYGAQRRCCIVYKLEQWNSDVKLIKLWIKAINQYMQIYTAFFKIFFGCILSLSVIAHSKFSDLTCNVCWLSFDNTRNREVFEMA